MKRNHRITMKHIFFYNILFITTFTLIACSEPIDSPTPNERTQGGETQGQQNQGQENQGQQNQGQENQGQQNQGQENQGQQNQGQENQGQQNQGQENQGQQNQGQENQIPQEECKPDPNPQYPNLITDEDWARALIAGKVTAQTAFPTIAYSCGFPVITNKQTALVIHWYTGEKWSIAGEMNNWVPQAMTQSVDGQIWSAEINVPQETSGVSYKLVKNDTVWQSDPWSLSYDYDNNGEFSYIKAPKNKQYLQRYHMFMSPQGLKTRSLYILIPPNDGPYDVVYAQDGQNLFQKDRYSGGWKLRENMTSIQGNFLIVGISNTEDRMNEYTHITDTADGTLYESKGTEYAKFVEESVRPFIESKYKTTQKAGLMGSSLGGLISLYIAHLYPDRYRAVLALSPTTAWGRFGSDNGKIIRELYESAGHRNTYLYLDNGGNEPEGGCPSILRQNDAYVDEADGASSHDNYCYTRDFVDTMERIGYHYGVDMTHWHERGAKHNEEAWAARVSKPLKIFKDLQ